MIKVEKTIDIIRFWSLGEQEGEGESEGESFEFMRISMGGGVCVKFLRVKVGGGRRGYCDQNMERQSFWVQWLLKQCFLDQNLFF